MAMRPQAALMAIRQSADQLAALRVKSAQITNIKLAVHESERAPPR